MHPKLQLIQQRNLIKTKLSEDDLLISLGDDKELETHRERDNYINIKFISGSPEVDTSEDTIKDLCSLDMVEELLDVAELYKEVENIYLTDDSGLDKAWPVCYGLKCYFSRSPKSSVFEMVSQYPEIDFINNLWVIDLFDLSLNMKGDLIQAAEDYVATNIAVSKYGEVVKGRR